MSREQHEWQNNLIDLQQQDSIRRRGFSAIKLQIFHYIFNLNSEIGFDLYREFIYKSRTSR